MALSEKYLTKFTELYQEHFGILLSRQEAYDEASKLLDLVKVVYRPMTEEDYQATKKRPLYRPNNK